MQIVLQVNQNYIFRNTYTHVCPTIKYHQQIGQVLPDPTVVSAKRLDVGKYFIVRQTCASHRQFREGWNQRYTQEIRIFLGFLGRPVLMVLSTTSLQCYNSQSISLLLLNGIKCFFLHPQKYLLSRYFFSQNFSISLRGL